MVCAVLGLYNPSWCWFRCLETGTRSNDWDQLSRFYLKTETESSLQNAVLKNKHDAMMDNVQKHNICTNSYLSVAFIKNCSF
jgi:hypothetical protein